ncbi:MAG: SDR family oxidoreductase [Pirellula sp.]|jgi:3-oxoacyl-[acyl-carrier protein] reductase|nr:SDR family oxidoreductase [Pirellula sp.]
MGSTPFVSVVTGSSSGIGRAVAMELAKRGDFLVVHGNRNVSGLQATANLCLASGSSGVLAIAADIQCQSSAQELVRTAFNRLGHVDAWVHMAGADVLTGDSRQRGFGDKLEQLYRTDVYGTMHLSRLVADRMLNQAARPYLPSMIHIGWDQSTTGMEGDSGQLFCTIKAAVAAFSKSLAMSVAPKVRVNCVAPGWIKTEWGTAASPAWDSRAKGESMLDRWGEPNDIAKTIAWLCSPDSAFVNGQTICVNGGWKSMSLSARCETTYKI